ncbi:hypothetical protein B0H63DRAFT_505672 [Podospora didyma]|uniref:Uncharacterized protein n=1 Tax=Podospora didyma TaxID=330526 RepID=A0AAE0U7W4_9PEZI|nr:hypothetical protein B0H63DRAFT_505672 [Podospora didyma]
MAWKAGPIFHQTASHFCGTLLSTALFIFLSWYVQLAISARAESKNGRSLAEPLKIDDSTTLSILRALQGLMSAMSSVALDKSFQLWHFYLTLQPNGLGYISSLALSPATGAWGTADIAVRGRLYPAGLLGLSRMMLVAMVWLAGLVLFFQIAFVTVYDKTFSYPVTAGVGPFNGSYVRPLLDFMRSLQPDYPYDTLPYSYYAAAYNLVGNQMFSTSSPAKDCPTNDCYCYLLSGGIIYATPWIPQGYEQYPLVKLDNVPSVQVDFAPMPIGHVFSDSDCDVFGQNGIQVGVRVCVNYSASSGALNAGLFVCNNGTGMSSNECIATNPPSNITTSFRLATRQATIVSSRSNFSIVSVDDLTNPIPTFMAEDEVAAYRHAQRWLLNFTAADIPAPSSIAQGFWGAGLGGQLENPSSYGTLLQSFQSLLVFPLWLFNANNFGNPDLQVNTMISTLPPQFYTRASIVTPYKIVGFNPTMFALFLAFQGLTLAFIWAVLLWVWFRPGTNGMPFISSFPAFDAMFKMKVASAGDWDPKELDVSKAGDGEILRTTKDFRIYSILTSMGEDDSAISSTYTKSSAGPIDVKVRQLHVSADEVGSRLEEKTERGELK